MASARLSPMYVAKKTSGDPITAMESTIIEYGTLGGTRQRLASFFQGWQIYFYTPLVYDASTKEAFQGTRPTQPYVKYAVHKAKTFLSEGLFRLILTAVYVLLYPNIVAANLSFLAGAVIKAGLFAGLFITLGYHGAWGRFENLLVSWYPSTSRAFAPHNHIIPYADFIGFLLLAGAQIAFSVAGVALGLWVINATTLSNSLPNQVFDNFGVVGGYGATTSDIWLVEFGGSAVITCAWLFIVVDFHGLKRRTDAGLALFFVIVGISGALFPITGANFDSFYFLAVMAILNAVNRGYGTHLAAYIVATIVGAIAGWVVWLVIAGLDWHIIGLNPGIPKFSDEKGTVEYMAPATLQQEVASGRIQMRNGVPMMHAKGV